MSTSDRVMAALPYASISGFVALIAVLLLGFEEPHVTALALAGALLLSQPAAVAVHLVMTSELSASEKRLWWKSMPRNGLSLLDAYCRRDERRAATRRLSHHDGPSRHSS